MYLQSIAGTFTVISHTYRPDPACFGSEQEKKVGKDAVVCPKSFDPE
jgi:hypothetical protein